MSIFYIDSVSGDNENDGLTESTAKVHWKELEILPGDTVLLKRGSVFRGRIESPDGTADSPIVWDAYGEGPLPMVTGAYTLKKECWTETETNIWKYTEWIPSEIGNVMFDDAASYGTFRWDYEDLCENGDFWDSGNGKTERPKIERSDEDALYVYCTENPGKHWQVVECATFAERTLVTAKNHVVIRNIHFHGSGVHGFAAEQAEDITIDGCEFTCIGGVAWDKSLKIRFGNAIEFWMGCKNITIKNTLIRGVYDSCFTHQGFLPFPTPEDIVFENNVCDTYGMAAYEVRDLVPIRTVFKGNTCLNAGCGFAMQGEELPRRSEIWPQPMGHHLFIWRIEGPTEGGSIEITDNVFGAAPNGSAVYSIIDPRADDQFIYSGNRYDCPNEHTVFRKGEYSASGL